MKNLETLLQDYNATPDIDSGSYNDLNGFAIWLSHKGYRFNNVSPVDFIISNRTVDNVNNTDKFLNETNIVLTNPSNEIKFDLIQSMQDKGLTFDEMWWLCFNLLDDIKELKTK